MDIFALVGVLGMVPPHRCELQCRGPPTPASPQLGALFSRWDNALLCSTFKPKIGGTGRSTHLILFAYRSAEPLICRYKLLTCIVAIKCFSMADLPTPVYLFEDTPPPHTNEWISSLELEVGFGFRDICSWSIRCLVSSPLRLRNLNEG